MAGCGIAARGGSSRLNPMTRISKLAAAIDGTRACIGTYGVWAAEGRYEGQCWTRDFAMAMQPLLLELGEHRVCHAHLSSLAKRQGRDGKIPILYLDGAIGTSRFLFDKTIKSIRERKVSFMLGRYLHGHLGDLTHGTKDSEMLFCLAVGEYAMASSNPMAVWEEFGAAVDKAFEYIHQNLMRDGLLIGADWRDTMHEVLGDKALLSNNTLLVRAYKVCGRHQDAMWLTRRINGHFWRGRLILQDFKGNDRADPLGIALAVLNNVVGPGDYEVLLGRVLEVDSPCGFTIQCRHNPFTPEEREVIDRTDGVVVWPFVSLFMVMALVKMARQADGTASAACLDVAREQFAKITALDGFSEWYDPATGRGYGAKDQGWSKTMYVRALDALVRD